MNSRGKMESIRLLFFKKTREKISIDIRTRTRNLINLANKTNCFAIWDISTAETALCRISFYFRILFNLSFSFSKMKKTKKNEDKIIALQFETGIGKWSHIWQNKKEAEIQEAAPLRLFMQSSLPFASRKCLNIEYVDRKPVPTDRFNCHSCLKLSHNITRQEVIYPGVLGYLNKPNIGTHSMFLR